MNGATVTATNTPFVLNDTENTLPAGPLAATEDTALAVTGLSVVDADADAAGRDITTTLSVTSGTLTVANDPNGAAVSGSGTNTVTLTGTVAEINTTLSASNAVAYTGNADFDGSDTLQVVTNDPGDSVTGEPAGSDTDTVAITVAAVNDAPVVTAVNIAVTEDTATSVTAISFADADAGSGTVTVTLAVGSGALNAATAAGVTVGGSATSLTLTGSIADINSFIANAGVTFTPAADSVTNVTLTTTIDDGGNTGTGGPLTDTEAKTLVLTAVNDAPVITSNGGGATAAITYAENGTAAVTTVTATDIEQSVRVYSVTGTDAALFTINSLNGVLTFNASPNFEAPADSNGDNVYLVNVVANDGSATDTQALTITVTDVNEPAPGGSLPPVSPLPTNGPDNLVGTTAADTISGGIGADTVNGGLGADALNGNQGNDTVLGGAGNDTAQGGQGNDDVRGEAGNDVVLGDLGNDTVSGGEGSDSVYGGQGATARGVVDGNDVINGNQGADLVNGNAGDDTVSGGQGDDSVFGGQGNDVVFGDLGNDRLSGDLGNDVLTGGAGSDVFVFAPGSGNDIITDFDLAEGDRLDLGGQTYNLTTASDGSAALILQDGDVIILQGVTQAEFSAAYIA